MGILRLAGGLSAAAAVLCVVVGAHAEAPTPLSLPSWDPVFQNDPAVRVVVARLGLPERAELVPLSIGDPWDAYELRIFYPDLGQRLVFMRARIGGRPISILREQGPIPDEERVVELVPVPRPERAPTPVGGAERRAAEAEAKAAGAEQAAQRAERAASEMARRFERSLEKN